MVGQDGTLQLAQTGGGLRSSPAFQSCTTSLIALVDESGSIFQRGVGLSDTLENWQRQLRGTADALTDERTLAAIRSVDGIAFRVDGFNDTTRQLVGWRVIRTSEDARQVAAELYALAERDQGRRGGTNIGHALEMARSHMQNTPCTGGERIIDVSSDGEDNNAQRVRQQRDTALQDGIRINGLAVGARALPQWMRDNMVTNGPEGNGGFVISSDWPGYSDAIRRKLVLEIAQAGGYEVTEASLSEMSAPAPVRALEVAEAAPARPERDSTRR